MSKVESSKLRKGNPLGMRSLGPGGLYVLPPQLCSDRRREYFLRANRILGSYTTITVYSEFGKRWGEFQAQSGKFNEATPMRLTINRKTMQTTYRQMKEMHKKGIPQLTNYIYLMVYGNFEAFLSDLVCDGLTKQCCSNPIEETVRLMMATKWLGKIDRISQVFDLDLGKRVRDQAFRELYMELEGDSYTDPIEFLQKMVDVRHRLIHYSGRADSLFIKEFPKSGLSVGDLITLPADLPYDVHFFFTLLTDVIDEAFSKKLDWPRTLVPLEQLV